MQIFGHMSLSIWKEWDLALELLNFSNKDKDKGKNFVFRDKARLNQYVWHINFMDSFSKMTGMMLNCVITRTRYLSNSEALIFLDPPSTVSS